ncbi:Kelch repeat-containing protein [Sphingobacterium litopenaei]|uniref:IPT/TIG domain-containing protein n=1 Tax=Sphingobacterium litopenaei TaxID=2763500 RepID=A0ABR7YET2_9SPHI|nr:kelch repeat-containing protein [Sphingobacterium litopenaei]MBD1429820.1 IPT/TIG domain-containing protein [Sphingobacterium litopenaei]
MRIKQLFIPLTYILTLISCEKKSTDSDISNQNKLESIELLNPEIMSDGGVKLSIKVNSVPTQDVYTFAIVVSEDSLFTKVIHTKPFELPLSIKSYSYSFSSGFKTNQKYYYSYMINYGSVNKKEIKSFVFGKEKMIQIDSISPRKANINDTLTLYGNFKDYHFTKIMVGDSSMHFAPTNSGQQIKMILGSNTPVGSQIISLFTEYQTVKSKEEFSLLTPKILSISNNVDIDQEITIHGENFSPWREGNKVYLNNIAVNLTSYSKNMLKFILPNSIKNAILTLELTANNHRIEAPEKLRLMEPTLLEAPLNLRLNQHYSLKFKGLPRTNYIVKLDDKEVYINQVSNQGGFQTISFSPRGDYYYTTKKPKLTLHYLDKQITIKDQIEIVDKWELVQSEAPFEVTSFSGSVIINNESYIGASKKDVFINYPFRLWKFHSSTNSFTEIQVPYMTESPLIAGNNNLIYLYTGKESENFHEYNPATKTWKKLNDYPGLKRGGAVMSMVNGKLYITGGTNSYQNVYNEPDNSLYAYNISANKWEQLADYPINTIPEYGNRIHATALSLNNHFIVVGGAKTTGNVEVMAYNTQSGQWIRKADYPPLMWQTSFEHEGFGFVLKDDIHKYDFNSDTWSKIDENILPYGLYSHTKTTFFKSGQYAYCVFNNSKSGFIRIKLTDLLK